MCRYFNFFFVFIAVFFGDVICMFMCVRGLCSASCTNRDVKTSHVLYPLCFLVIQIIQVLYDFAFLVVLVLGGLQLMQFWHINAAIHGFK